MSWQDYAKLIEERNLDPAAWRAARKANPNTPEAALKWAIRERVISTSDETTLDDLVTVILGLADNHQLIINIFDDFYELLDRVAQEMGDTVWFNHGATAHEALVNLAGKYDGRLAYQLEQMLEADYVLQKVSE